MAAVGEELSNAIHRPAHAEPGSSWRPGARVRVTTDEPERALGALAAQARRLETELGPWVSDVEPLDYVLRRLLTEVG